MLQVMLGQLGIVTSEQMFSIWRYVVVGSTVAAAVLTPSTDPFTQVGGCTTAVGMYRNEGHSVPYSSARATLLFVRHERMTWQGARRTGVCGLSRAGALIRVRDEGVRRTGR